jgi:hypothetical protein
MQVSISFIIDINPPPLESIYQKGIPEWSVPLTFTFQLHAPADTTNAPVVELEKS